MIRKCSSVQTCWIHLHWLITYICIYLFSYFSVWHNFPKARLPVLCVDHLWRQAPCRTAGGHTGPTQCHGSSVAFTRPRADGFTRASQTDLLHIVKPSTRGTKRAGAEDCIESSPAPSGGTKCAQPCQEVLHVLNPHSPGTNGLTWPAKEKWFFFIDHRWILTVLALYVL